MDFSKDQRPLTFKLVLWYGHIFATMFILYGGINIILAFMDHNYDGIEQPIGFLFVGLALIIPAAAYKERKPWGFWGLVVINALVVLLALVGYANLYNLVPLVLSGVALVLLFHSDTKKYLYQRG
ncbi:MAG: hypothetical protein ABIE70_10235 [bacterium]